MKEALNLWCMQVHGNDAISSRNFDGVSTDTSANRHTRLVLLIPLGIAEVGNNYCDRLCTCAFEGIYPEQQFHEIIVGGKDGGLHEVDAAAAHVLQNTHKGVTIREMQNLVLSLGNVQVITDASGEFTAAAA